MRSIISVSIPEKVKKEVEKRAKKAGKTVSGYVIHLFQLEKKLISEDDLVKMAKKGEDEYMSGKVKKLRNLDDLIKK